MLPEMVGMERRSIRKHFDYNLMKFLKKHPVLYDKVSLETTPIQSELIATLS